MTALSCASANFLSTNTHMLLTACLGQHDLPVALAEPVAVRSAGWPRQA